jgi:prophage DNA circulation protein
MNTEEFIKRANEIWNNKYDYSNTHYKAMKKDITFLFNGIEIKQRADKHLNGQLSLYEHNLKRQTENLKMSNDEFIIKAKAVWSDKYDYSCTNYKTLEQDIEFIWNGNKITQNAQSHLEHKISKMESSINNTKIKSNIEKNGSKIDTNEFIRLSKKMYGNMVFDYSKVNYINNQTEIILIYDNLEYKQLPKHHLNGSLPRTLKKMLSS